MELDPEMTDADALARFETLVQSQRPADTNWSPVTDYSATARRVVEGPMPALIEEWFAPKRILDAGCGYGYLVQMLVERGHNAYGFDKQSYPSWLGSPHFGLGRIDDVDGRLTFYGTFDLVICREVLEHLTIVQLRRAVTNLCAWSSRYVYLTTRFNPKPDHLLDVATSDALDPTHITMLNQNLLRTLFVLEGFVRRPALETALDWMQVGRVLVYERA